MSDYQLPITQGKSDSLEDFATTNSRFVNWVIDSQGAVHQRPAITQIAGLTLNTSGTAQYIIGSYVWRSPITLQTYFVYVRADRFIRALSLDYLTTTDLTVSTDLTTYLDGGGLRAVFTEDSIRLIIAGGGQIQAWTGAGLSARLDPAGTWAPTTNAPPLGATHVAFLGNYIFANNSYPGAYGQFFWSNLGDGTHQTWNPLNFNTADASPDRVTGVYSSLAELFVFGEKTLQVYGIGSDQYLPPAAASAISIGCGAPYSPVQLEDKFAFLDDKRRIVISDGRSYEVISTAVEQTLRTLGAVSDCHGFRYQGSYYDMLVWMFPAANTCLTYDMRQKVWGTWESLDALGISVAPRIASYAYWAQNNTFYVGDTMFENVFSLDSTVNADVGGAAVAADMILNRDDSGTPAWKGTRWVDFFIKRGASFSTGVLEFAVRDDDAPWKPYLTVPIGAAGDYTSNIRRFPGGVYQRRQRRIRYSGSAEMAISGIMETFEARMR